MPRFVAPAALVLAALSAPAFAGSVQTLDLSGFVHGKVLRGTSVNGVTIDADNFHTGSSGDYAVVFDTNRRNTADPDLQGFSGLDQRDWARGNLRGTDVGNILIIQEKNVGRVVNGVQTNPDDEGRRPAGELRFAFDRPIDTFGFDLIDVEGTSEFKNGSGFFATFTSGSQSFNVKFKDLIKPGSMVYDGSIVFGDNSANRVQPVNASMFGVTSFDKVVINLGGSGGVGNIVYGTAVPTPTAALAGAAMLGAALLRRRRAA